MSNIPADNESVEETRQIENDIDPLISQIYAMTPATERSAFLDEVNSIDDTELLRRMVIQKEKEKDDMAQNLDVAARVGLAIS